LHGTEVSSATGTALFDKASISTRLLMVVHMVMVFTMQKILAQAMDIRNVAEYLGLKVSWRSRLQLRFLK